MAGFGSNPAAIFEKGDVSDMIAAVFDAPMTAEGVGEGPGGEGCLARVTGDFVGRMPHAGFGVLVPGQAGDAGDADDQSLPVESKAAGNVEDLDGAMLVPAMATAVNGLDPIDGWAGGRDGLDVCEQGRLVVFHLGEQEIAGICGGFESFFGSAWRRR